MREILDYFPVTTPSDLYEVSRFSLQEFKKKKKIVYNDESVFLIVSKLK